VPPLIQAPFSEIGSSDRRKLVVYGCARGDGGGGGGGGDGGDGGEGATDGGELDAESDPDPQPASNTIALMSTNRIIDVPTLQTSFFLLTISS